MIRLTLLTVIMMGEIAVTLTVTLITVQSAYATIKTIVLLGLLPLLLEMAFVMMRLTMQSAIMMEEIVAEPAHRGANVRNVPVLVELMMILVKVSPTVSSFLIFSNGVHTGIFYITKLG